MVAVLDPYKILQVPHSASALEIKRAYRSQARKYHPDKYVSCPDEAVKERATSQFAVCAAAYSLLTDAKLKAEYDHIYKYGGYDDDTDEQDRCSATPTGAQQRHAQQHTRKRKSTGIGYTLHDPCTFLWTKGSTRCTVAGIHIPSRIQTTAQDGLRFSFSSGHVINDSGTTKCISQTTQYFPMGKKKHTTTETVTYHPDGRKEVVIMQGDNARRQYYDTTYRQNNDVSHQQQSKPWYRAAWDQIQDKLTMCYNPCAVVTAPQ